MKDLVQIWNRVTGRQYASVNSNEKELKDLTHNRLNKADIDTSAFEINLSECEGLNNKFNDDLDFNERKDEIINRLFKRRRSGHVGRQPKRLFLLFLLGFVALGVGFFIIFLHPYNAIFNWKIVLSDGGEIFEMWKKPEVKLYTKVYLFNITNADDYMSGKDDKIKVKEVGPYVYREALEHSEVKFNDNGTLSTIPRHPLIWEEELSEGNKEDDMLYLPHIALLSIANVVSQQNFMTRFGLNNLIRMTNSQPLAKMTAKEFMMGYKSELMSIGNTFLPGWIYFDKLGLIDRMYDFDGDYETIFTGENDISLSGLIDTYRGSTDLPQWDGKHCSNVQYASDGTKFKGAVARNETILFYRKSLCRSAPLIPAEEGTKHGFKAYKYVFPEHMLDNGKHIEENKCFCRYGKCLPEGLIDVTDCYYGFPIALSYPHFYKGEDILFSKVEGLTPNKEQHETRFWIQPDSGLPLDITSKFQINMALGDISLIENTARFANMHLPLLWFDITMSSLPSSMEQKFKFYLNIFPLVEQVLMYLSFVAGTILILVTTYILTFEIMFKSFGEKKHSNINIRRNIWMNRDKKSKGKANEKDGIYVPCDVPLSDTDSDLKFEEARPTFIKSHSDRIKEFGHKLSDRVYDSVENVRGMFDDLTHVRSDRKNSLIPPEESQEGNNEAYKSDSGESDKEYDKYREIKRTDSDDDSKYLEVVDDGSEFDESYNEDRSKHSNKNELYIHIN
ncbi:scavenger receptor class B member 1-like isoform X1 [Vanessa atalanta]|uniref:scavenger receptor class B member 1-like isoform X1 n=1 Tax=Vanessa atalanta TaxID=42275 RepID=UPI001FCDA695|nr:scavenger receptor class B member 1-like isoform X1 [Vanessa atalanta]